MHERDRRFLADTAKAYRPDLTEHAAWELATSALAAATQEAETPIEARSNARWDLFETLSRDLSSLGRIGPRHFSDLANLGWGWRAISLALDDGAGPWDDREIRRWINGTSEPPPAVTMWLLALWNLTRHGDTATIAGLVANGGLAAELGREQWRRGRHEDQGEEKERDDALVA